MKLLVDAFSHPDEIETMIMIEEATESSREKKNYFIHGIFAQAEQVNRNGRLYPRNVMESAFDKYKVLIDSKRALGELMHPATPQVSLERASHLIESLTWDGHNVKGRARIMTEMPMGKIAKGLIDEGVKIGVSTRGLGSLNEKNGTKIVQNDFYVTAIDIVGDPSGPDCWVQGIMEQADWIYEASTQSWIQAVAIKKSISRMTSSEVLQQQTKMFQSFLEHL